MAKKKTPKDLIIASAVFLGLLVLTFTVLNRPQCPENYSQAQIDAANCIVGANIGMGVMFLFLIPYAGGLLLLWAKHLSSK